MKQKWIVLLGAVTLLLLVGSDGFPGAAKGQDEALVAAFKARFDLIDANKDGKVTRDEYVKFHAKQADKRFNQIDKGKKGYVTKEEVEQIAEKASEKMKEKKKMWQEKKKQMEQQQQAE
jgi:Ca2+-binding EF-hand superfamily protein